MEYSSAFSSCKTQGNNLLEGISKFLDRPIHFVYREKHWHAVLKPLLLIRLVFYVTYISFAKYVFSSK